MFCEQRRRHRTSAPQFPEVRENASRLILAVSPRSSQEPGTARVLGHGRDKSCGSGTAPRSLLPGSRGCFLHLHKDRRMFRVPRWPATPRQQQCGALPAHTRGTEGATISSGATELRCCKSTALTPEPFALKDGCKCKIAFPFLHSSLFLGLSLEVLFPHLSSLVGDVLTNS